MTLNTLMTWWAEMAIFWAEIQPWVWFGLAAAFVAAVIIAVRHAELQDPSLEEQRSDFAQLLPKDPPVVIDRRFTSYRRVSGLFDVEDK